MPPRPLSPSRIESILLERIGSGLVKIDSLVESLAHQYRIDRHDLQRAITRLWDNGVIVIETPKNRTTHFMRKRLDTK